MAEDVRTGLARQADRLHRPGGRPTARSACGSPTRPGERRHDRCCARAGPAAGRHGGRPRRRRSPRRRPAHPRRLRAARPSTPRPSKAVEQSIEVIRRRIDQLGTKEPDIARQGTDRIVIEAAGESDPEKLKAVIGKTAKLTFQMVDEHGHRRRTSPPAASRRATRCCSPPTAVAPQLSGQEARCRHRRDADRRPAGLRPERRRPAGAASASTARARAGSATPPARTSASASPSCSTRR